MDHGAWLKRTLPNPCRRSRHHARQGAFAGSRRQARGAVLRGLTALGPSTAEELAEESGVESARVAEALAAYVAEGLVTREGERYRIA